MQRLSFEWSFRDWILNSLDSYFVAFQNAKKNLIWNKHNMTRHMNQVKSCKNLHRSIIPSNFFRNTLNSSCAFIWPLSSNNLSQSLFWIKLRMMAHHWWMNDLCLKSLKISFKSKWHQASQNKTSVMRNYLRSCLS